MFQYFPYSKFQLATGLESPGRGVKPSRNFTAYPQSQMTTEKKTPCFNGKIMEDQWFLHDSNRLQTSTGGSHAQLRPWQVSLAEHLTESTCPQIKQMRLWHPNGTGWQFQTCFIFHFTLGWFSQVMFSDVYCFLGLVKSTNQTREFSPAP